jgi:hypothetical protein
LKTADGSVAGDDGRPLVESKSVDQRSCTAWRETLREVEDTFVLWSATNRRASGTNARRSVGDGDGFDDDAVVDVTDEWDREGEEAEPEAAE